MGRGKPCAPLVSKKHEARQHWLSGDEAPHCFDDGLSKEVGKASVLAVWKITQGEHAKDIPWIL